MGQIQSLDELISLLMRRRLLIAAIVLAGMAASVMLGLSQPKIYETGAVIQVESPVVTGPDASIGSQSARVLQAIEQRLTTRENLTAIIERHGLFSDAPGLSMDQKIAALRAAVRFQSVPSVSQPAYGAPASVSALIIFTQFGDGDQAARVANDFAQSVLDLSAARQDARARETLTFFVEEEARVSAEIVALEAEMVAFKTANAGALPSSGESRRDEIAALETDMRALDQAVLAARSAREALQAQDRLRETDRRQIEDLAAQISVYSSQKDALQQRRDALQSDAAQSPEVEQQLAAYDRRLTQLQSQLDVIAARRAEADTTLRLEEQQHSEHFTLLERALVPDYPMGGGGKKIAILGSIASAIFAVALAFTLDLLNPVVRSAAQMERQLGICPVMTIPDLHLPSPKRRRKYTAGAEVVAAIQDKVTNADALSRTGAALGAVVFVGVLAMAIT